MRNQRPSHWPQPHSCYPRMPLKPRQALFTVAEQRAVLAEAGHRFWETGNQSALQALLLTTHNCWFRPPQAPLYYKAWLSQWSEQAGHSEAGLSEYTPRLRVPWAPRSTLLPL